MSYVVALKTALVDAIDQVFDEEAPDPRLRDLKVSIEMPVAEQDFPSIWVDFTPSGSLTKAGVGHVEAEQAEDGRWRKGTRWRFQGHAEFTLAALSSLARDRLHDEFVRVIAFGEEAESTAQFRRLVEHNEFIAMNIDFDEFDAVGASASPGTPWGTSDSIYEITMRLEVIGEFVSDGQTGTLLPLTAIEVFPYATDEEPPLDQEGWR